MPAEEEFTDALDTMDETQKGIDKVSDSGRNRIHFYLINVIL